MNSDSSEAAWRAVQACGTRALAQDISALFDASAERSARYAARAAGISLHYAKQRVDDAGLEALLTLAATAALPERIAALYAGERVNVTEARAALHMALRSEGSAWRVGDEPVDEAVRAVRDAFLDFADGVRSGGVRAVDGEPFSDVINIGIGGSDLGPRMVCHALGDVGEGPRVHFVANVDPEECASVLARCEPARTLVVVTSKTFRTQETMANARAVRRWLVASMGEAAVAAHFVAVSTNVEAVRAFGIAPDRIFGFWDWVGGRYSVWSAVGLPVALALGPAAFRALMRGAAEMDAHFRDAPMAENLPVLAGLLGVWNRNALGLESQVVVPYAQRLAYFVPWLQQLEMESNGKGVTCDGVPVPRATTPALWGGVGTNAQHAFFQMLHQGPSVHPVDFILPLAGCDTDPERQRLLVANCLAQASALMRGLSRAEVEAGLRTEGLDDAGVARLAPHRSFPGNRPSSTIILPRLDAYHLGALMAFYEHRAFVQSVLWGVNAFDQWGVELGKRLAGQVAEALRSGDDAGLDEDTRRLVQLAVKSLG